METVVQIFSVLLLIAASLLCIYLIIYLKKIVEVISDVRRDINQLSQNLLPLVESLQNLSNSIIEVSEDVKSQISKVRWIFDEVKERFEKLFIFEQRMKQAVEVPANNLFNNLQAIKKGVSTFFTALKK